MGDTGDDYRAMAEHSKQKRASNREQSAVFLSNKEIMFEVKNGGAHLIVEGPTSYIDFWPGTGKWIARDAKKTAGFGVRNLTKFIYRGEQKIADASELDRTEQIINYE